MSSRFCLAFFIVSSFAAIGLAYAYDSNSVASICVRHNQQPSLMILAQQKETLLSRRVIWIRDRERQRIHEGRNASRKAMRCFLRFASSLAGSHSNVAPMAKVYHRLATEGAQRSLRSPAAPGAKRRSALSACTEGLPAPPDSDALGPVTGAPLLVRNSQDKDPLPPPVICDTVDNAVGEA